MVNARHSEDVTTLQPGMNKKEVPEKVLSALKLQLFVLFKRRRKTGQLLLLLVVVVQPRVSTGRSGCEKNLLVEIPFTHFMCGGIEICVPGKCNCKRFSLSSTFVQSSSRKTALRRKYDKVAYYLLFNPVLCPSIIARHRG